MCINIHGPTHTLGVAETHVDLSTTGDDPVLTGLDEEEGREGRETNCQEKKGASSDEPRATAEALTRGEDAVCTPGGQDGPRYVLIQCPTRTSTTGVDISIRVLPASWPPVIGKPGGDVLLAPACEDVPGPCALRAGRTCPCWDPGSATSDGQGMCVFGSCRPRGHWQLGTQVGICCWLPPTRVEVYRPLGEPWERKKRQTDRPFHL